MVVNIHNYYYRRIKTKKKNYYYSILYGYKAEHDCLSAFQISSSKEMQTDKSQENTAKVMGDNAEHPGHNI